MDDRLLQRRVLMATSISYVVVILDTSIVNVALEPIAGALGTDVPGLQWVVNAYTLTFASLLLTGGTLGDRFGARNVYVAGLSIFTLASGLCGLAPVLPALILARMLQGAGAAMLVPCSLALINQAFPDPRQRSGAFGLWAGLGGVAMAAGPLVGGILIHALGWRSIFLANLPIGIAGMAMAWRVVPDRGRTPVRPLDLAGQIAAIVASGGLTTSIIEGPALGWLSLPIIGMVAAAMLAGITFLLIESRRAEPMLPLSLFRNAIFSGSVFVSMVSAFSFYGLMFALSLLFQRQRGYPPLWAGIAFLPLTVLISIGSLISRKVAEIVGPRRLVTGAFVLSAAGFLTLPAVVTPSSPYWLLAIPLPAIGVAASLITPAATAALMETVEKDRAGIAAGVLNAARQTGAALGVASSGALISATGTFQAGMVSSLVLAAALSLIAALSWWLAFGKSRHARPS